jgi:hypothetical protein
MNGGKRGLNGNRGLLSGVPSSDKFGWSMIHMQNRMHEEFTPTGARY